MAENLPFATSGAGAGDEAGAAKKRGRVASIAVVIPTYNGAEFLAETLRSVLAQTRAADEVIVVDDGSSDGSAEIAEAFPQVRVVRQANAGVSAARNHGVEAASAEWIAFLDDDDRWAPEKLAEQCRTQEEHPEAEVCITGRRFLHLNAATGVYELAESRTGDPRPLVTSEEIPAALYDRCPFTPSCVMVRRSALLRVGGFDSSLAICEDWDLWIRLLESGAQFVTCPQPLLHYRFNAGSVSHDARRMMNAELALYDRRIAPRIGRVWRALHRQKRVSELEAEVAILERAQGNTRCVATMLKSLARFPFGMGKRYKIAAHMLLHRGRMRGVTANAV